MPDYGYVWMPDAGADFKPYATNGHWVYTDEGWAWDSGYPWGWATFHYGRWFFQDGYGWMWIPGNEWAPAWVEWRNSDDYYGWAPLGPNVSFGVAIGGGYTPPPHYWSFVPHQYVGNPQMNNYYVRENNNVTIINRTTIINNTTVINNGSRNHHFGGPDPNDVGRFSGRPVRPIVIRDARNPGDRGNGNDFAAYRPRVSGAPNGDNRPGAGRPAPTRYQSLDNARPVNRNSYGNNNPPANNNPYVRPGAQPVNNQPVNNPPANRPAWNQPANNQPVNNPPVNNQPVNGRPNYNQPANNPPMNNPPANRPAWNQPANNQPANNQPANNPPVNNNPYVRPGAQPVNNPPVNNPPANNPPANTGRPNWNQPGRPVNNQPANNPPVNNNPPANNPPARNPAFNRGGNNPAPAQQSQGRPSGFERNNTPAVRPVAPPRPSTPPAAAQQQPKKDDKDNKDKDRQRRP
jgi:hypothetical protein